MSYIIKCWIPIEPEDSEVYETYEKAHSDLDQLELMQPENIYKIEEVLNLTLVKTLGDTPKTRSRKRIRGERGCRNHGIE
jgi:hypothetical protein